MADQASAGQVGPYEAVESFCAELVGLRQHPFRVIHAIDDQSDHRAMDPLSKPALSPQVPIPLAIHELSFEVLPPKLGLDCSCSLVISKLADETLMFHAFCAASVLRHISDVQAVREPLLPDLGTEVFWTVHFYVETNE